MSVVAVSGDDFFVLVEERGDPGVAHSKNRLDFGLVMWSRGQNNQMIDGGGEGGRGVMDIEEMISCALSYVLVSSHRFFVKHLDQRSVHPQKIKNKEIHIGDWFKFERLKK